jgi:hypothetical protein
MKLKQPSNKRIESKGKHKVHKYTPSVAGSKLESEVGGSCRVWGVGGDGG